MNPQLKFFLNFAKAHAIVSRRFDAKLSAWGIGFNDFRILFYLSQADGEKMRRIDLAEKIGLTASGVTRLLAPMEKIGLIKREANEHDARVSFVALAPGGKRLFTEALDHAEILSQEWLASHKSGKIQELSEIFALISIYLP